MASLKCVFAKVPVPAPMGGVTHVLRLRSYQVIGQTEVVPVVEQYGDLTYHPAIAKNDRVKDLVSSIDSITTQRTITITMDEDDIDPYKDEDFCGPSTAPTAAVGGIGISQIFQCLQSLTSITGHLQTLTTQQQSSPKPRNIHQIQTFDGRSIDASLWMKKFEKACELNGWVSDTEKINELQQHLSSLALTWYDTRFLDCEGQNWEQWKISFCKAFTENTFVLAKKALSFEYREGNSVNSFFYEKCRLLTLAFPSADLKTFVSLFGLCLPPEYQQQILQQKIESKEDLRLLLETLAKPIVPGLRIKQENKSTGAKKVLSLSEEKEDPVFGNNWTASSSRKNRNFQDILINGVRIEGLVDSGADVSLIRKSVVDDLRLERKGVLPKAIFDFEGKKHLFHYIVNFNIDLGFGPHLINAYVSDFMSPNLLIGDNDLQKMGLKLTLVDNKSNTSSYSSMPLMLNQRTASAKLGQSRGKKKAVTVATIRGLPSSAPASGSLVSPMTNHLYAIPRLDLCLKCNGNLPLSFTVPFRLVDQAPVVQLKFYRLNSVKLEWARRKIHEMLDSGVIRHSTSEYATPCVLAPKGENDWRLCQNYIEINKHTILDPYPFPLIDEIINSLGGCNYFSTVDLKDGFWQIPLTEETKKYTAFVLPFGLYEFNVLPFGWKNSPPKFQRIMDIVLEGLLDSRTFVYIDDIMIGGRTKEECQEKTNKVLKRLEEKGFKTNLHKSTFVQPSVRFLGRIIDGQTKTTKEESVEKVKKIQPPKDLHSLQCILGLTGYFRAFIKGYASIARPLEDLKKKNTPFEWTEECQQAFDTLKSQITSNPILDLPDWTLNFELSCDASHLASGAVLFQRDSSRTQRQQLRVIGYYSYTFNSAERNYSVTEKEGLAVKKALEYFRSYLDGRKFIVFTDHQALTYIRGLKEARGRLARWQEYLLSFDMEVKYRPGPTMKAPDAISRLCIDSFLEAEQPSQPVTDPYPLICLTRTERIPVTPDQIPDILKEYHDSIDSGGHDGITRTYYKIRQRFYWKGIKKDVRDYVLSCPVCQVLKLKFRSRPDQLYLPDNSTIPFHTIHLDFGEHHKKSEGNKTTGSFLVAIDECTKLCAASPSRESSAAVIKFIDNHYQFRTCKVIVTDNGTAFTSKAFVSWAKSKGIQLKTTSPYAPSSNGLAENKVKLLKSFMSYYPNHPGGWRKVLESAVAHENLSYNISIGCSPIYKATKLAPLLPADERSGITGKIQVQETEKTPEEIQKYRETIKLNYDRRHVKSQVDIKEGDEILVRLGLDTRRPTIIGPFSVRRVIMKDSLPKTIIYKDRGLEKVAHIRNVRRFHRRIGVQS